MNMVHDHSWPGLKVEVIYVKVKTKIVAYSAEGRSKVNSKRMCHTGVSAAASRA